MNTISVCNRILWVLGVTVYTSLSLSNTAAAQSQFPAATTVITNSQTSNSSFSKVGETPVPGSVATTAAALIDTPAPSQPVAAPAQPNQANIPVKKSQQIAQSDIDLGRRTRGGSSYIGVAGNIGLNGGQSALGDGNFAVISKVGLTRTISVRPAAVFGDNTAILLPITYDFAFTGGDDPFGEPLAIAPYLGIGAALSTGENSEVAFLLSGGVDLPLNEQFTATASVNAGFYDETDIGLLLGVGYNFR